MDLVSKNNSLKKRIFISVPLNDCIKQFISNLQIEIQNKNFLTGKFVEPENLHLTINFIGYVNTTNISLIIDKLKKIEQKPFVINCNRIEFINLKQKKMLWISVISPELENLAQKINFCLQEFIEPEKRPFSGHITVIRIKEIFDILAFKNFIQNYPPPNLSLSVNQFDLIESQLTNEKPIYNEIFSLKLN